MMKLIPLTFVFLNTVQGFPGGLTTSLRSATEANAGECTEVPGPGRDSYRVRRGLTTWPWRVYQSSNFTPPEFEINKTEGNLAPGLFFLTPGDFTPVPATKQRAPFIMDATGDLIYGLKIQESPTNFRVQQLNGKPVLTYWHGNESSLAQIGHGYGAVSIRDTSYKEIHSVCPKLGLNTGSGFEGQECDADMHEAQLTDQNTILVSAYNLTTADLTSVGGPKNGYIFDCLVYELDPATSKVLWSWSAAAHVPINASQLALNGSGTKTSPYDWFHLNSIQRVGDHYVINSRHCWTTYYVNKAGHIMWRLEGDTGGDFGKLPANGHFRWQHHVRIRSETSKGYHLTMFNNYNSAGDSGTNATVGLELFLPNPPSSTPITIIKHLEEKSDPIYVDSQGSFVPQSNGNTVMGYGQMPLFREWDPHGKLLLEASFGAPNEVQSYRVFKNQWHATPDTRPALVVKRGNINPKCKLHSGYVSWNGATDVTSWIVYAGKTSKSLKKQGRVEKKGFETAFNVAPGKSCVQVGAVQNGTEIKKSVVVCL